MGENQESASKTGASEGGVSSSTVRHILFACERKGNKQFGDLCKHKGIGISWVYFDTSD